MGLRKHDEQVHQGPSATTEPPWGWGSEDKYADMKAAYLARDARLVDVAERFGLTRGKLCRIARNLNWPKRKRFNSDESIARRLATCRATGVKPGRKQTRPLPGTPPSCGCHWPNQAPGNARCCHAQDAPTPGCRFYRGVAESCNPVDCVKKAPACGFG